MATSWVKAKSYSTRAGLRAARWVGGDAHRTAGGTPELRSCVVRLSFLQIQCLYRQVPVRIENLKPALLLALVGRLIGPELLLQSIFLKRLIGHGGILEYDGYAVVPTPVFGSVIARLIHPYFDHAPHLDFFLEQGIVVLLEQPQELIRMSPLGFVVVLDRIGLTRRGGGALRNAGDHTHHQHNEQKDETFHG